MSKFVPFTVHISVTPKRTGKRWEYIRDLQKQSVLVYDALTAMPNFQFATPGGGQAAGFTDVSRRGGFGDFAQGTAVKPQIGENPAQLMITGFYSAATANAQPYADHQVISGGVVYRAPGAHSNDAVPASTVMNEVKAIKAAIISALAAAGVAGKVFRLDYSGITYGDKGFHFPQ